MLVACVVEGLHSTCEASLVGGGHERLVYLCRIIVIGCYYKGYPLMLMRIKKTYVICKVLAPPNDISPSTCKGTLSKHGMEAYQGQ